MPAPSAHSRALRLLRLTRARLRRRLSRLTWPLWRFTTWIWVAASALVGFEMLEVILGGMLLAPELVLPVLLVLAIAWQLRDGIGRGIQRLRRR